MGIRVFSAMYFAVAASWRVFSSGNWTRLGHGSRTKTSGLEGVPDNCILYRMLKPPTIRGDTRVAPVPNRCSARHSTPRHVLLRRICFSELSESSSFLSHTRLSSSSCPSFIGSQMEHSKSAELVGVWYLCGWWRCGRNGSGCAGRHCARAQTNPQTSNRRICFGCSRRNNGMAPQPVLAWSVVGTPPTRPSSDNPSITAQSSRFSYAAFTAETDGLLPTGLPTGLPTRFLSRAYGLAFPRTTPRSPAIITAH